MSKDLIKRIETLEKQMAMIHTFHTPLKAPLFRPQLKYATGILVEGLDKPIEHEKNVEFTHQFHAASGWSTEVLPIDLFKTIHYMGKCEADGDMFYAESHKGYIHVLKGNLNSGTY